MAANKYTATPMKTATGTGGAVAASGSGSMVTYPAYTPTNYFSAYNNKPANQKVGLNVWI